MDGLTWGIFVFAAFAGGFVSGFSGFAMGLVVSCAWLHIITPLQTAALIAGYRLWIWLDSIGAASIIFRVWLALVGVCRDQSPRKPLTKSRSEKRPTLNAQSPTISLSQWPTQGIASANRRK